MNYLWIFLLMFSDVPFCHEILSTNVTVPTKSMWLSIWKRHLMQCIVKCVESFSIKSENHETPTTKHHFFVWFLVEDINISDIFYKIQNLKGGTVFPVVPLLRRILQPLSPLAISSKNYFVYFLNPRSIIRLKLSYWN